ncbi:MAG: hypothetical protein FJ265_06665 [Planctomycetes bacterium]|nr:hypothetical protein [Planctomycetota bacterium]
MNTPPQPHATARHLGSALVLLLAACAGVRPVGRDVYRSSQPSEDQLLRAIDAHGIRTVVCLRSPGDGAATSARAASGTGIRFWTVPMSATRLPSPETLLELWQVAATAERPLLLHCRAGVDRTGLASAITVLHDTADLDRARAELSLLRGHVGLFGTEAMDEVLDRYAPHQGRMAFPDWVREVYAVEFAAAVR